MDGLEAIRRIKATDVGQATTVLAVSASTFDFSQKDALAAGADGFLPKPYREAELFDALGQALGLEYGYEEPAAVRTETLRADRKQVREALGPELGALLRQGARLAHYDALLGIIETMEGEHPQVARELKAYLERFDYPGLVRFLDELEVTNERI